MGCGLSNNIGLEAIHRFSYSVKTKEEPLFQSNIFLDPNLEVTVLFAHICWFNLAAHAMKCLSVLSSFTVKIFKESTIIYIIQTL